MKRVRFSRRKSKRTFRKRRRAYPSTRVRKDIALNTKGVHYFTRWCNITSSNLFTSSSTGTGGNISFSSDSIVLNTGTTTNVSYFSGAAMFTMNMLGNYTEYTTMFDQYKIRGALIKITPYTSLAVTPAGSSGIINSNNQGVSCMFHSVLDFDDATAPTAGTAGIATLREYKGYKSQNFFNNRPIVRYCKPRMAVAAYAGAFTSYANVANVYCDSNSPGVQHYGFKWIAEVFQPDNTVPLFVWFKMEVKLYLECRQPI